MALDNALPKLDQDGYLPGEGIFGKGVRNLTSGISSVASFLKLPDQSTFQQPVASALPPAGGNVATGIVTPPPVSAPPVASTVLAPRASAPVAPKYPAFGNEQFEKALADEGITGPKADFARAIYGQESGSGANTTTSNRGARGGMQVIDGTFDSVADKGWDRANPEHNARAGIRYASQMHDAAGGDAALAGAGYYGGPGGMEKARLGIDVTDPKNPNNPGTLAYGQQILARMGLGGAGAPGAAPLSPEAQRLALWDQAGAISVGNGAGAVSSGGGAAPNARGIVDPSGAIRTGFNQQLNYQQQALQNIMDAARGGDSRNYSYRLAHMIGAMGQNNFGSLQLQGADNMNNANVNAYGSELSNEASHNTVDNQLKMERERTEGMLKQSQMQTRQGGTTTNMVGGIPINSVTEALAPKIDSKGMVTWEKVGASADRAAAKTGIHVDASGNRREYFPDGTFKDLPKAK